MSISNYSQLVNPGSLRLIENDSITMAMRRDNDELLSRINQGNP